MLFGAACHREPPARSAAHLPSHVLDRGAAGTQIVTLPRASAGVLRLALYIDAGSRDASPPQAATIAAWIAAGGGEIQATVYPDVTELSLPCQRSALSACIDSLARALSRRDPTAAELERARIRLRDAQRQALARDPLRGLDTQALQALLGADAESYCALAQPAAAAPGGESDEDGPARSAAHAGEFLRDHYGPGRVLLVAAGDVEPAQMRDEVERAFAQLPAAARTRQVRQLRSEREPELRVDFDTQAALALAIAGRDETQLKAVVGALARALAQADPPSDLAGSLFAVRGGALALLRVRSVDTELALERALRELARLRVEAPDPAKRSALSDDLTTSSRRFGFAFATGEPPEPDNPEAPQPPSGAPELPPDDSTQPNTTSADPRPAAANSGSSNAPSTRTGNALGAAWGGEDANRDGTRDAAASNTVKDAAAADGRAKAAAPEVANTPSASPAAAASRSGASAATRPPSSVLADSSAAVAGGSAASSLHGASGSSVSGKRPTGARRGDLNAVASSSAANSGSSAVAGRAGANGGWSVAGAGAEFQFAAALQLVAAGDAGPRGLEAAETARKGRIEKARTAHARARTSGAVRTKGELDEYSAAVTSENGVRIGVQFAQGSDVAIALRVGYGAEQDPPLWHGRSALAAILASSACAGLGPELLRERLSQLGATLEPRVDAESYGLLMQLPREHWRAGLDLALRCLRAPSREPPLIADAALQLQARLRRHGGALGYRARAAALLVPSAPGKAAPWGDPARLGNLGLREIDALLRQTQVGSRWSIGIAGPVAVRDAVERSARRLADLPPHAATKSGGELSNPLQGDARLDHVNGTTIVAAWSAAGKFEQRPAAQLFARAMATLLSAVPGITVLWHDGDLLREGAFAALALRARPDIASSLTQLLAAAGASLDDAVLEDALSTALAGEREMQGLSTAELTRLAERIAREPLGVGSAAPKLDDARKLLHALRSSRARWASLH